MQLSTTHTCTVIFLGHKLTTVAILLYREHWTRDKATWTHPLPVDVCWMDQRQSPLHQQCSVAWAPFRSPNVLVCLTRWERNKKTTTLLPHSVVRRYIAHNIKCYPVVRTMQLPCTEMKWAHLQYSHLSPGHGENHTHSFTVDLESIRVSRYSATQWWQFFNWWALMRKMTFDVTELGRTNNGDYFMGWGLQCSTWMMRSVLFHYYRLLH